MRLEYRLVVSTAIFLATTLPLLSGQRNAAEAEAVARRVLERAIIIDTHVDTPQMMLDQGYDLADPTSPYMISIPKMRAGHFDGVFFSIWVETAWPRQDLIRRAIDLIDIVYEQLARHRDSLELANTADEIVRVHRQGRIAALLGIEGGHIIEDDLRALNTFYRLGVRYMTLTHSRPNNWADSSGGKPRWNGLNDFGRKVVERMNRLGMMVDISHVSDKAFYDTLAVTRAPVIASHSSCRALCNVPRNMNDDMLRALAKNGGVIQINFNPGFIDPAYDAAYKRRSPQIDAEIAAARAQRVKEGKRLTWWEETSIARQYEPQFPTPNYTRIADHIDHAVNVAGIDHVGLGSDFDGIYSAPQGMEDASKLPDLVRELARRGYSEEDLEKILGSNLLRVMRQVEQVSRETPSER